MNLRRWLLRQKPYRFLKATQLTLLIWRSPWHPGYDAEEPFDSINLKLAWDVARGIWLEHS